MLRLGQFDRHLVSAFHRMDATDWTFEIHLDYQPVLVSMEHQSGPYLVPLALVSFGLESRDDYSLLSRLDKFRNFFREYKPFSMNSI